MNASTAPDFLCGYVEQQRISWGGGCEEPAFVKSLHDHISSGKKGASAIGPQLWGEVVSTDGATAVDPQLWGEVVSTGGRGQKSLISSGLFSPHAVRCSVPKQQHQKGLASSSPLYLTTLKPAPHPFT